MAMKDLNTNTGVSRYCKEDGTIINLAERLDDDSLTTHVLGTVLKKLNVDTSGRLRVSAEANANITTVTNVSAVGATSIGIFTSLAWTQKETQVSFDCAFKKNLTRT